MKYRLEGDTLQFGEEKDSFCDFKIKRLVSVRGDKEEIECPKAI